MGKLSRTPARKDHPLADETVDRLRTLIARSPDPYLPTMAVLAKRFGVSRPTVSRAAARLRDEGVLVYGRGRRMRIRGRATPAPDRRPSAASTLHTLLRTHIRQGRLRSGQSLPKLDILAREYHVSKTTVVAALRGLGREELVSRTGKEWRVGPAPPRQSRSPSSQSPFTIVMLFDTESAWVSVADNPRTRAFATSFRGEAERYGLRIVAAFTDRPQAPPAARVVGTGDVESMIERLGSRYQGTLIPGSHMASSALVDWVEFLAGFGRPVVWFDGYDRTPPPRPATPLFTRCHFSEKAAVDLAIRHLAHMGHRTAVTAVPDPGGWQTHRARMLAEAGVDEGITIHTASATRALAATPQRPRGFTYEPVVRHILSFRDATALLVPHDYTAYYFYHILTSRGVAIPRQLSVLSFDNSDRLVALPLSTIDFGFGYLGYAAFHTIFGVIKPLRTHEGDIAAKPYLVDRGSVAVPRSGSLRLRRGGPGWERLR